ncbi:hypothetical protein PoB_005315600 [Plakobranchus ocellatus]|uniref:Uncharacterized protein n=1 Tax=Plakobranchus ocellatus TaxID=259542 RepID=A0AAV4BTY1_9GAST|nr:hypothetical protein PoB_005315600 [Plakobranchus ocellatus]
MRKEQDSLTGKAEREKRMTDIDRESMYESKWAASLEEIWLPGYHHASGARYDLTSAEDFQDSRSSTHKTATAAAAAAGVAVRS